MTKTLKNLTFVSNGNDWFWDNDENGMTYFIYDRNHELHDAPEQKRYQIIMTPQSEIGDILKLNIIPEISTCVLESDDCGCMNSWASNMKDGLFPICDVPQIIVQQEALKQYFKSVNSDHLTEADSNILFKKALNTFNITESDISEFIMYEALDESEEKPANFENTEKFMEGAGNIAANIGAGGVGALIMQLTKALPGPLQAVAGIGTAIGAGVAKYFGTAASIKRSDEYKNMVAEGKSEEASKLVKNKSLKSAAQAVAAAGAGALVSKFLPGIINKIFGKSVDKGSAETLGKAATDASKVDTNAVEKAAKVGNNTSAQMAAEAGAKNAAKAVDFTKMKPTDIDPSKFGAEEYQKFIAANPQYQGAQGLQKLFKDNPALSKDFTDLQKAGIFKDMSYEDVGQVRNAIRNAGGDTSVIQKYINDAAGINGANAMNATGANFTADWAKDPYNPVNRAAKAAAAQTAQATQTATQAAASTTSQVASTAVPNAAQTTAGVVNTTMSNPLANTTSTVSQPAVAATTPVNASKAVIGTDAALPDLDYSQDIINSANKAFNKDLDALNKARKTGLDNAKKAFDKSAKTAADRAAYEAAEAQANNGWQIGLDALKKKYNQA